MVLSSVISPPFGGHTKTETGFKSRDGDSGEPRTTEKLTLRIPTVAIDHTMTIEHIKCRDHPEKKLEINVSLSRYWIMDNQFKIL